MAVSLSTSLARKLSIGLSRQTNGGAIYTFPTKLLLGRWKADQIPLISGSVSGGRITPASVVDLGPLLGAAANKDNYTGSGNFEFFDEAPSGIYYDPSNPTHWTVNAEDLSLTEYESRVRRDDFKERMFPKLEYAADGTFLGLSEILYYGELDGSNNPVINSALSQPVDVDGVLRYVLPSDSKTYGNFETGEVVFSNQVNSVLGVEISASLILENSISKTLFEKGTGGTTSNIVVDFINTDRIRFFGYHNNSLYGFPTGIDVTQYLDGAIHEYIFKITDQGTFVIFIDGVEKLNFDTNIETLPLVPTGDFNVGSRVGGAANFSGIMGDVIVKEDDVVSINCPNPSNGISLTSPDGVATNVIPAYLTSTNKIL